MQIETLVLTPFMQNTRIISFADSENALVIDPGGEASKIVSALNRLKKRCTQIWLTHSHVDHCGAVKELLAAGNPQLFAHPNEKEFRSNVVSICRMYGIEPGSMQDCPEPHVEIAGGETLQFESASFDVLFTPGHSPGHLSFYNRQEGLVISGDVLFASSIGRTDLPGGNHGKLLESIRMLMETLPPDTRVLPGHGPETTLKREAASNPFLKG